MATKSIGFDIFAKDRASGVLHKLGASADHVAKRFGKTGATFDRVGQAAGKGLAVGLLAAGAAAMKMTHAAAADEMAAAKLATTLRNAAGATQEQIDRNEEFIASMGRTLGVADDELRPALGRLAVATGSVEEAQSKAMLAMNIAAGTGKSLTAVTEALAKAENGSLGGLARLGVATKNAAGETKSLDEITTDLASTYAGQAARAADTAAGRQKRLQVAFSELQEEIGAKLLPVMTKLAAAGLSMVEWVDRNQRLVGILMVAVGGFAAVLWTVSAAMRAWLLITKLWAAVTKVATALQWAWNAAMAANPIGLVVIAIAALVAGLIIAYKKSETFRNIVNAAFGAVAKAAGAAVDFIKRHWKLIFVILTGPVGLAVLAIAKHWGKIKSGLSAVVGFVRQHWRTITTVLVGPIATAVGTIARQWGKIKTAATTLKEHVVGAFSAMKAPIIEIGNWASWLAGRIQSAINKLGELKDKGQKSGAFGVVGNMILGNARGTNYWRGGVTLVGEEGPELVDLPTGSRIFSNAQTRRIANTPMVAAPTVAASQAPIIVQLVAEGRVLEQVLIEHTRKSGRPLQVRALPA